LIAGNAHAGYTTVSYRPGGDAAERNQAEIMARFYGNGTFNTTNFTSANPASGDFVGQGAYAGINFRRVQDFIGTATTLGLPLDIHANSISGVTDQVWQDGVVQIQADAKYAGFRQRAGFKYGDSNVVASNQILDVTAVGSSGAMQGVVTSVSAPNGSLFTAAPGSYFRLTRSGDGSTYGANEWSSRVSENGGIDHMITYKIEDAGWNGGPRYFVFFDDQGSGSDRDFNDFSMTLTVVPLPAAAWAGVSTLMCGAGIGALRRRRVMLG
jgi:hypothetical protein